MAEITMTHNTKTKEFTVTKDGKKIPNVHYISVSKGAYDENDKYDENRYSLEIHTMDKSSSDEGYCTHQHIVANENGDIETLEDTADSKFVNFLTDILGSRRN